MLYHKYPPEVAAALPLSLPLPPQAKAPPLPADTPSRAALLDRGYCSLDTLPNALAHPGWARIQAGCRLSDPQVIQLQNYLFPVSGMYCAAALLLPLYCCSASTTTLQLLCMIVCRVFLIVLCCVVRVYVCS
jgi:hypothetical protein